MVRGTASPPSKDILYAGAAQPDSDGRAIAAVHDDHIAVGRGSSLTAGWSDAQLRDRVVDQDSALGNRHTKQGV